MFQFLFNLILVLLLAKKIYNFDEDCTLYAVSYAFAVAFHPKLKVERIYVDRSFNHTFDQLNDVSYLSNEMLLYIDPIAAGILRDCVLAAHNEKARFSLTEMFS